MALEGHKGDGAGVFTLDESSLELMLTSVDCPGSLNTTTFISTPYTPGPDRIRQFLKACNLPEDVPEK
jgi:hypothetical protein